VDWFGSPLRLRPLKKVDRFGSQLRLRPFQKVDRFGSTFSKGGKGGWKKLIMKISLKRIL